MYKREYRQKYIVTLKIKASMKKAYALKGMEKVTNQISTIKSSFFQIASVSMLAFLYHLSVLIESQVFLACNCVIYWEELNFSLLLLSSWKWFLEKESYFGLSFFSPKIFLIAALMWNHYYFFSLNVFIFPVLTRLYCPQIILKPR